MAAVPAVCRTGTGCVVRNVAHRGRSRRENDYLSLRPPDPPGGGRDGEVSRLPLLRLVPPLRGGPARLPQRR